MTKAALAALALVAIAGPAQAVVCSDTEHLGQSFTICEVDTALDDLQLFLRDDDGDILGGFSAVESYEGRDLLFAMNAGMYHDDRRPVGHYVESGVEEMRIVTSAGPGNFGLLPNGIFCIADGVAQVYETQNYIARNAPCPFATQSGPMLVIDNELHPRLIPNGTSTLIRNGVGTSLEGDRAVFAISNDAVNFHDFATLFRDHLGLPNALFLDGSISRLYAPSLNRSDFGFGQLGPIVGVLDGAGASN